MLIRLTKVALVAQLVEHVLGKDEVTGSIPVEGSSQMKPRFMERLPAKQSRGRQEANISLRPNLVFGSKDGKDLTRSPLRERLGR
jgi:hypothetical protein